MPKNYNHTPVVHRHTDNLYETSSILDHERVMGTPSPVSEMIELEQSNDVQALELARRHFDYDIEGALQGRFSNAQFAPSNFYSLRECFFEVASSGASQSGGQSQQPGVYLNRGTSGYPTEGSYASLLAAKNPHPEQFLTAMYSEFAAKYPRATRDEKGLFATSLSSFIEVMYGERGQEYNEQRNDLRVAGPEGSVIDKYDAKLREVDAEILGKSYRIRKIIQSTARLRRDTTTELGTGAKNIAAMPKLLWQQRRLESVESKLQRKRSKAQNTSHRLLRQYREKKADKYENKVVSNHRTKHLANIDARAERNRVATEKIQDSANIYHNKVDYYKARKQQALARKAMRRELRESNIGYFDKRGIMRELKLDPEATQRLGRAAAISKSADRGASRSKRYYESSVRRRKMLNEKFNDSKDAVRSARDYVTELDSKLEDLTQQGIPVTEAALKDARANLAAITDPDSPGAQAIRDHMDQLEVTLEAQRTEQAELQHKIARTTAKVEALQQQRRRLAVRLRKERNRSATLEVESEERAAYKKQREAALKRTLGKVSLKA